MNSPRAEPRAQFGNGAFLICVQNISGSSVVGVEEIFLVRDGGFVPGREFAVAQHSVDHGADAAARSNKQFQRQRAGLFGEHMAHALFRFNHLTLIFFFGFAFLLDRSDYFLRRADVRKIPRNNFLRARGARFVNLFCLQISAPQ